MPIELGIKCKGASSIARQRGCEESKAQIKRGIGEKAKFANTVVSV